VEVTFMRELFSHVSGTSQSLKSAGSSLIAHLLDADYGHSATALLGIAALGILLAFPTLMF
jgi:hypothetical protein